MIYRLTMLALMLVLLQGCMTPAAHVDSVQKTTDKNITTGLVQKEIHEGMSQADVITVLGSPNIVTRDSNGLETWVYDKIRTEQIYSKDSGYGNILVLGYQKESGAQISSQRTLTVILKFKEGLVNEFSYHGTSF